MTDTDEKKVCLCGKEGCDGTVCQCGTSCDCHKPKTEEEELKEMGVAPV